MNVARNLGGSIGISLANVVITQHTQLHQSRLVEHLVPSSPVFQSTLQQMTQYFMQQGASATEAHNRAIGLLGQVVGRQAAILAYIDVFQLSAIMAAVLIPVVLIVVRRVQLAPGAAVTH